MSATKNTEGKKENTPEVQNEESKIEVDPNLNLEENFNGDELVDIQQKDELMCYKKIKWTIWEFIDYESKEKNKDYCAKLRKVCWFDNLIQFHKCWNIIPHAKVSTLLITDVSPHFKQFKDHEMYDYQVSAFQMFKTGIRPEWEDPVNQKGSEYRIELSNFKDDALLQKLWETMVFDLVVGKCPCIEEGIAGIRLVQKSKQGNLQGYRAEIWLMDGAENSESNIKIKKYIDDRIKGDVFKDTQMQEGAAVTWKDHK